MSAIGSIKEKTSDLRRLCSKLLFVVLAFVLMVGSSCLYVSNMLHDHLKNEALGILTQAKLKIETDIIMAETILENISGSVREIILRGGDKNAVSEYLRELAERMKSDISLGRFHYHNVFGYFNVFDDDKGESGKYINGEKKNLPEDYDATKRPWYKAAETANGAISLIPVYKMVDPDEYVMSYSCRVFGNEGNLLFTIGLNITLNSISKYVSDMKLTKNSHGILESKTRDIIAHSNLEYIGRNMLEINEGFANFTDNIQKQMHPSQYEMKNYKGDQTVVFAVQLDNGWILSEVVPKSEYYQELSHMVVVVSALGAILAAILIVILVRIDGAKKKADEVARQQAMLLESMATRREKDEHTHLMLDGTPMGCTLWNRELKACDCNEAAVRLFGSPSKQEFCDRFFEMCPAFQPCGRPSREKALEQLMLAFEGGYQRFEWVHKKLNGELMPTEVTLVRVTYGDDYVVAGYIRDLAEHHKMLNELHRAAYDLQVSRDAAECANHAKSAFLANMSHEMRTPLNVIIGLTDLHMDEKNLPDAIQEDVKKINKAGNILLSIVNDVLDISKIEAGKLELVPAEYNTASLFNDIITLNIIRIDSKPITFDIDIDEEIPCDIFGDELRLKQICNNLLSNAFKYTLEGNVTFSVKYETEGTQDLWLSLSVSDTGIGIRPDDLKKLFFDYNQVDTQANRHIEGTGLGLSITKKLVELMDGEITVTSEYGKGTTFHVRLRQGLVTDKPLGRETVNNLCSFRYIDDKRHVSAKLVRVDMGYARVLVVDDFQTNLDVATGLMRKYNIKVDCVTRGQDAVDRIQRGEPVYNAVFMDHMMPGMDGIEATKRIRALDSEYARTVPIISLTANAIAGNEQMFLDSGFQAFLSKPIDMMKLDLLLKQWVRNKHKETSNVMASPLPEPTPEKDGRTIPLPGIHEEKALSLYGYDLELYLPVLRSYAANTPAVIDNLRHVTEETLSAYATNVHGLKGASGSIGAEEVRSRAEHLEAAAKAGNLAEVLAGNEILLKESGALVAAIQLWLHGENAQNNKPCLHAPAPALLTTLRQSCEQYNMNEVDAAMEQLESACYDINGSLIVWLREKVDTSDFAAITARLKEYEEHLQ